MIVGETVYVLHKEQVGTDEFNAPIWEDVREQVDDVLVSPGDQNSIGEDVIESERPDGARVKYTLHFPKTYLSPLAHLKIEVRGQTCAVIGYPDHYIEADCPTKWSMPVNVEVVDG